MSGLPQIQSVVNALGWTLIHFLWQGLAIASIYWLLCRLTRPENATLRYWAGMILFLVAGVVPVVTYMIYWQSSLDPVGGSLLAVSIAPVSSSMNLSFAQVLRFSMEPAIPVVVGLWAVGVVFLSLRAIMGWLGVQRLVSIDTEEVSASLLETVKGLMAQLGVRQAVHVLKSTRVLVPTVVGWLKPVILLPAAVIAQLPEDQLEMVIAHELGHIRRYDYLFNLLQMVIETLFFYHPAIRWMSRQVRQEREHCCDDLVVAQCDHPVLYAKALANLEVLRDPLPAVALSASGGDLVFRVRRIIQKELPGHHSGFAQLATMLGVAVMVSAGAHQGLEMRRHLLESSMTASIEQPGRQSRAAQDRSAWVQGIEGYTRLSAEQASRAAQEDARRKHVEQQAKALLEKEASELQAIVHDSQVSDSEILTSAAESFEENSDDALLLASNSMPFSSSHDETRDTAEIPVKEEIQPTVTAEIAVAPVYPFKARRKRLDGHVRLEFSVNELGKPENIRVVDAQPADIFEKSAINALQKWQFKVTEGLSENHRLYQTFDFGMEEGAPVLPKRERRCDITGSRICGLQSYNDKN